MANIIRKMDEFIVDSLGTVTVYTPINGAEPTFYRGKTVIGFTLPNHPPTQIPLEFGIADATSVEDAFARFADAAAKQFKKEVESTKA